MTLRTFGEFLIVFSTNVNLLYILYGPELWSSTSHKVKLFAKRFSRNSRMTQISLYLFSIMELT